MTLLCMGFAEPMIADLIPCDYPVSMQVFRSIEDQWKSYGLYCEFHFQIAFGEDRVTVFDRICVLEQDQEPYERLPCQPPQRPPWL